MPILDPNKRSQLIKLGFNPDEYDDIAAPVAQTEQQSPSQKTSVLGAGTRSFARNVPSSGIGLAVGSVLSGVASPLVGIPAGIIAGMGSRYFQDKAIEKLAPESLAKSYAESEKQDLAEHPTASAIGGALSSLPFLKPDIKGVANLGKAIVGSGEKTLAKETAKNMALNSGIQLGSSAVIKGIQEGTLTPDLNSDDATAAGIGAILSKPTALGSRLPGMSQTPLTKTIKTANGETTISADNQAALDRAIAKLDTEIKEVQNPSAKSAPEILPKTEEVIPPKVEPIVEQPIPKVVEPLVKPIVEEVIPQVKVEEVVPKTTDELLAERSKYERGTPEFQKAHEELMAAYEKESAPAKVEEVKTAELKQTPEDVVAAKQLNEKLEVAKGEGIDTTDPEQITKIHESPVSPTQIQREPETPTQRFIFSAIDAIRKQGPEGLKAGDAMAKYYDRLTELRGKFVNSFGRNVRELADLSGVANKIKSPMQYLKQNTPELEKVRDWFWAKHDGTTLPTLNAKETAIRDEFVRVNRDVRDYHIRSGIPTSGNLNPDYLAQGIDSSVMNELANTPHSDKSRDLKRDFIDYVKDRLIAKGANPVAAQIEAVEKLNAIVNPDPSIVGNTAKRFGAIDKAAGEGIPISWRNKNILDSQNRYLTRVARRFAYEEAIKPDEALINTFSKNKNAKAVMEDIGGIRDNYDDPLTTQLAGLTRSAMMGTMTGEKDFGSTFTLGWQHITPVRATVNMLKSWSTMKQNIAEGFETGRIRIHMNSLEYGNGFDDIVGTLRRSRDVVSDITARNWFDQMARASTIGQGRFTTLDYLSQLNRGKLSKTGIKWFNDFAKDIPWQSGNLTPEQIKTISARYVDSVQGTYDYRMLPRQAVEGTFSPVLSLARWSIEKSNNYLKYTIHPALDGNFTPLLSSTLGIVIGGEIVKEIVTANTRRKDIDPSFREIYESKKAGNDIAMPLFYKFAGLASAAGHIGFVGDLTKSILDKTYGENRPAAYNNIILEAADNIASVTASWIDSIKQDGFHFDTAFRAIGTLLESTTQNYRLIQGFVSASKKEDIDKANKFRDLRVFNTLSGNKITDLSSPFKVSLDDVMLKKFKNETDPLKVRSEMNALVDRAYKRSGGDMEKFAKEIDSLKRNSYQTMPNPERDEKSFREYYQFLEKTQGRKEADKRLLDYAKRNLINQAKSEELSD